MERGSDTGGVRSVQRALSILSLLSEDEPTLSIREIVDATGLPKSTAIRMAQVLESNGLLWQDDAHRYVVGPSLLRLSRLAAKSWQVSANAHRALRQVAEACGETAHLYIRHGSRRVCIAQHEGRGALRHVVRSGDELPLWAGGVAKVLLIGALPELLRQVARTSPHGLDHLATLERWVAGATEQGYGVSHGEREVGLSAVAVPLYGSADEVIASLSVGGPTARLTEERIPELVRSLQTAAAGISEADFARIPLVRRTSSKAG
jgi:DNA-binding IclR family transcriptional regulator